MAKGRSKAVRYTVAYTKTDGGARGSVSGSVELTNPTTLPITLTRVTYTIHQVGGSPHSSAGTAVWLAPDLGSAQILKAQQLRHSRRPAPAPVPALAPALITHHAHPAAVKPTRLRSNLAAPPGLCKHHQDRRGGLPQRRHPSG